MYFARLVWFGLVWFGLVWFGLVWLLACLREFVHFVPLVGRVFASWLLLLP